MRLRVLVCTNVYPPRFVGGAELVAHEVACRMVQLGAEVAVFTGDISGPGGVHALVAGEQDGLRVYRVPTRPSDYDPENNNYVNLDIDRHFETVLNQFQPDIVHVHNLMGLSLRILSIAAESGARVFMTLHDFWGFCLRQTLLIKDGTPCLDRTGCKGCLNSRDDLDTKLRLRRDMIRLAFDYVDTFIAPSRYLANAYIESGAVGDRLMLMANGIDSSPFKHPHNPRPPGSDGTVVLLYAGHFGAHKGLLILLRAIGLMETNQSFVLDLVGDGPLDASLRTFVRKRGLADRVRFRGKVSPSEMPKVFAACDVFVLPSIWAENQPVCLMEAMASGKPVVASRIGGIPEMFEHGREGLLVPANNAVALAEALDCLVSDLDLRNRLGLSGRAKVEGFGYSQQAEAMIAVFTRPVRQHWRAVPSKPISAVDGNHSLGGLRLQQAVDGERAYVIPLEWLSVSQRAMLRRPFRARTASWIRSNVTLLLEQGRWVQMFVKFSIMQSHNGELKTLSKKAVQFLKRFLKLKTYG